MARNHLYAHYVSDFKGDRTGSFAWWDHKLLPLLHGVRQDAPILELGCGSGALLAYLSRRGFSHAQGIDISPEQIALAHGRGVRAECADALEYLAGKITSYQAVIAVDVLEHFGRDEVLQLTQLTFDSLQNGGRLIVQTANGAGLFPGQVVYGDLTHQTIFTPESLAQLLKSVGFDTLSFYETGPIPIRLRGRLDVALWWAIKTVANTLRHVETGKRQAIWTENFLCRAFKPK